MMRRDWQDYSRHCTAGAGMLVLALLYAGTAKLGFTVAFQAEQVTLVWPPTGISLAALLMLGMRYWPGVLLGAFLANYTSNETMLVAGSIASGNTLEALTGVWLLRRVQFDTRLHRVQDVLALTLCSAVFSTTISATIGVVSLCAGGLQPWHDYAGLWLQWWLGDAAGALIIAPALLVWAVASTGSWLKRHGIEMLALIALLSAGTLNAFTGLPMPDISSRAFIYLALPFVIWAALRLGQRGTTLVTLTLCGIAVWATVHGFGPFGSDAPGQRLILLQLFMMICSVTGLCLGAALVERKAAEASALETGTLLASIVESSETSIISTALDGTITSWNSAAEHLFGYSAPEMIGQHISLIMPEGRAGEEAAIIRNLCCGQPIRRFETERVKKNGQRVYVSLTISPIRDKAGTIIGISKLAHDITQRKLTEQELKNAMEELTSATRVKGEFLANMSHEIRTPLNSIIGTSELLTNTVLSSEQSEYVETINAAGDVLLSLINNILDYSKIESGSVEILHTPVMLQNVLEEVVQVIAGRAKENGVMLSVTCQDGVPLQLLGDPVHVKQILLNLAGNAVKFSARGQVSIRVETLKREQQNAKKVWLRFNVEDTGPGIPADKTALIFEKFTQLDEFSTKKYAGTGLGLAICKRLTEMMGGSIGVESTVGKGSHFWFDLPFERDISSGAVNEMSMQGLLKDKRALLIDSFAQNRRNVLEYLNLLGIRCDSAVSVQAALLKLEGLQRQGQPYHLVLVDDALPETSPEKIRLSMQLFQTMGPPKLLLLTSFEPEAMPAHLRDAPFAACVHKPVNLSVLLNTIINVLGETMQKRNIALPPGAADRPKKIVSRFHGRVLLVEDYPPNRQMARKMLEKMGCSVEVAQNGEEALVRMAHDDYDVVFMDCQMPEMDGFQTTAEIRRREKAGHTVIVAMTANALSGDRERCIQIGMDDYISKPFCSAELSQILSKYLVA